MSQRTLVEVVYADGSSFEQTFDGETIVVGVGPEADLQIRQAPEVDPQHLLIMPRLNGAWVSAARGARVRPLVGGAFFENGLLPWGTEIDIGSVTLRPRKVTEGGKRRKSWPLLAVLVPLAAFGYFSYGGPARLPRTSAQPPALFSPPPATCPDPQRPLVRAAEALALGDALEAQHVYDPQKGIAGTAELGVSEVCAAQGRNLKLRDEARRRRLALESRIDGELKAQRVLLDRAVALNDAEGIFAAIKELKPYIKHRPGAYGKWLEVLEQHVALQVEALERRRANQGRLKDIAHVDQPQP